MYRNRMLWLAAALFATPALGLGAQDVDDHDLMDRFHKLDANDDGRITPDELDWPMAFRRVDRDGDSAITPGEVEAFMKSQDARRPLARGGAVRPPTGNPHFERREFVNGEGSTLIYYLMAPSEYDAERAYPLVLALHGRGGRTQAPEALGREDMRERFPCFVMAPAAPPGARWAAPDPLRLLSRRPEVLPLVFEVLDSLLGEFSIEPSRLYVTGQSMGGVGTYGALVERPEFFAAAAPICGAWAQSGATAIAQIPIWVFHGEADQTVPVTASRDMVAALREAGGEPRYTEYEGVGHNSWVRAYEETGFWEWLFSQRVEPVGVVPQQSEER